MGWIPTDIGFAYTCPPMDETPTGLTY